MERGKGRWRNIEVLHRALTQNSMCKGLLTNNMRVPRKTAWDVGAVLRPPPHKRRRRWRWRKRRRRRRRRRQEEAERRRRKPGEGGKD